LMFFRKHPKVVSEFERYLEKYESINFSIITYYEVISGLKYRDARKQLSSFLDFAEYNHVLPLTIEAVTISANIYADLRTRGQLIDDVDIIIAGVALANSLILVTNNEEHFKRIRGLEILN